MADLSSTDATFLFVGSRDGAAEAVFALLGERGAELEWSDVDGAKELSFVLAPDVLVLVGTAAAGGGAVAIETLQEQGIDEELTIAVLSDGDPSRRSADAAGAKGVLLQSPHRAADDLIRVALGEPVPLQAPKAEAKVEAPKPEAKPAPKAEPAKVAAPKPVVAPPVATKPAAAAPSAEPTKPGIVAPPAAKPEVAKPAAKPIVAKPGIAPRPAAVALPPGASKPEPKAEAKPEPKPEPKVEPKVEPKPEPKPEAKPIARPPSVAPPARPASVPPPARAPSVPPRPASVPPPAAFALDDDEVRIPSAPPLPPSAVVDARSVGGELVGGDLVGGDLVGGDLVESLPPSLVPPPRAEAKPPDPAKADPPKPPEPPKGGPPRPPVAPKPAPPKVDSEGPASADDWRDLPSFAGDPLAAAPPPASPEKAPLPVLPPPAASPSPIVAAPAISEPLRLSDPPPAEGNRQVLLLLGAATAVVVVIGGAAWALMPEEPPPRTYHPVHLTAPPPIVPPPRPDVPVDAGVTEDDDEEVPSGDRGSIDELINGANYNRQHGALDRAEEGYRTVLSLDARNQRALVGMARVALARGDHTTALTWARTLTTEHPRSASNQILLGDVLRASGDRDGARRAYEQALAIAPSNETARERLDGL